MTDSGGRVHFYLKDDMGNVVALTDKDGTVIERYEYGDFGEPTIYDPNGTVLAASAFDNTLLYGARPWEPDLKLYNFRYRWYDPAMGRFINRDPIGLWGDGLNNGNGMSYTPHSPWSYTDPLGLWCPRILDSRLYRAADPFYPTAKQTNGTSTGSNARITSAIQYGQEAGSAQGQMIYENTVLVISTFTPGPEDVLIGVYGTYRLYRLASRSEDAYRALRGSRRAAGSGAAKKLRDEYWRVYEEATKGRIDDLESTVSWLRLQGIRVKTGAPKTAFRATGEIDVACGARKWELYEEYAHRLFKKAMEEGGVMKEQAKTVRALLKRDGIAEAGGAAEEIVVKQYLIDNAHVLGIPEVDVDLLRKQIDLIMDFGHDTY